jgi:hypothetical protein
VKRIPQRSSLTQKGLGMKQMFVIGIALLFFSLNLRLTGANDDSSWSSSVDGLQARLSFERGKTLNGTPLFVNVGFFV